MRIIPVIDIRNGQVVHAVAGQRDRYQSIQSQLCPGNNPRDIVQAFLNIYHFDTVYIADLDAIAGMNTNSSCIRELTDHFHELNFWLDQGKYHKQDLLSSYHECITHVIGSETGVSPALMKDLLDISPQPVLSLDFINGRFLGNQSLMEHIETWPDEIIIMDMSRVGRGQGYDRSLLGIIKNLAAQKKIYVGGGTRNHADLQWLHDTGVTGILTATALHTGQLTSEDIAEFVRP